MQELFWLVSELILHDRLHHLGPLQQSKSPMYICCVNNFLVVACSSTNLEPYKLWWGHTCWSSLSPFCFFKINVDLYYSFYILSFSPLKYDMIWHMLQWDVHAFHYTAYMSRIKIKGNWSHCYHACPYVHDIWQKLHISIVVTHAIVGSTL